MPCAECRDRTCFTGEGAYPDNCPVAASPPPSAAHPPARCGATTSAPASRLEDIVEFARWEKLKRIGVASCIGLHDELRVLTRLLRDAGFETASVMCKTGGMLKKDLGVPANRRITTLTGYKVGCVACNPIAQALVLNRAGTDLNLILGLCVGHDSIFSRYSHAPVATFITKDRSNGHNPAAVLYTYYGDNFFGRRPKPDGALALNSKHLAPADLARMAWWRIAGNGK